MGFAFPTRRATVDLALLLRRTQSTTRFEMYLSSTPMRSFASFAVLLLCCSASPASAAPPTSLNGNYTFDCADATLTLSLILAGGNPGNGDANGGSNTVPIYCGPNNPDAAVDPPSVLDAWNAYQLRLDTAETEFESGCNTLVANLFLPARPEECRAAAAKWRQGLEELNDNAAGLAPEFLRLTVQPGDALNEIAGLWPTYTSLFLADGSWLPISYTIDRVGKVFSVGLNGAKNLLSDSSGCAGALAVVSEGYLRADGTSVLVNDYGGILTCGVAAGDDLWIAVVATAAVHASTTEVGPPTPTPPEPLPTPTAPSVSPPTSSPPDGCFSGRTQVQVQGKGVTRMDELKIGDAVLTSDGTFSKVYSFGHKAPADKTQYLQIWTKSMDKNQPLEVTADHILYVFSDKTKKTTLLRAGNVQIGDSLVTEQGLPVQVTSVRTVEQSGVYAPYTVTGDIVVNGVAASIYVALPLVFQEANFSFQQQHWVQHMALAPHRIYCSASGGCHDETYDETTGLSKAVMMWLPLLDWFQAGHGDIILPLFCCLLTNWVSWAAAIVGYMFFWKQQQAYNSKAQQNSKSNGTEKPMPRTFANLCLTTRGRKPSNCRTSLIPDSLSQM